MLADVAALSSQIAGANFATVAATTSADGYANLTDAQKFTALSTVSNSINYSKVRTVYLRAVDLVDDFSLFNARYLGAQPTTTAVDASVLAMKRFDRAANRFDAFDTALAGTFNFDALRTSFLANQAAVTSFVVAHPAYTANILTETRAGAQAGSLNQDGQDIAQPVAVNRIQYDLFESARAAATADLAALDTQLKSEYTRTVGYWWFTRSAVSFSYAKDERFVQQKAIVAALTAKAGAADGYADQAEGQQRLLSSQQAGFETTRDVAAANVDGLRDQYEALTDQINGQLLVLPAVMAMTLSLVTVA